MARNTTLPAAKKKKGATCSPAGNESCCTVEAIVSLDDRGQIVIPRELRERFGLTPGDKLTITAWEKNGEVCCLNIIKAARLEEMVKGVLAPVMSDLL